MGDHDRRAHFPGFPVARRGRADFGVRDRGALRRQAAVDQGIAVTPGAVRSSSGVEMLARGIRPAGAITP